MNTRLPLAILSLALVMQLTKPALCDDAANDETQSPRPQSAHVENEPRFHSGWGAEFRAVPGLLRMHVPALHSGHGLVVHRIAKDAATSMLQVGDVVLSTDGKPVKSLESLPANMTPDVLVLRRGQVMPLGYPTAQRGWHPYATPRMGASVSTSAFSTGNESVSISQNGNEILIEMSLPDLEAAPIRYRGTAEQIEQQVRNSNLSPAARQRVLDAIR